MPVKVLVIDDSALARQVLAKGLALDPQIKVVGAATDPFKARDMILKMRPHVLTLDIEMPRMNGLDFLKRLMNQYPLPVIMVSALSEKGSKITLEALASGAVDFVVKPKVNIRHGLNLMMQDLRAKVKMAAKVDVSRWGKKIKSPKTVPSPPLFSLPKTSQKIIAIGASTGGTEAIRRLLSAFPPDSPGMVIVQHMPPGFTQQFAMRLNALTSLSVKEARSGDLVIPGQALIAPGDYHLQLIRSGTEYRVLCRGGAKVNGHRPSVDVLFRSVAKYAGANAVGIMLTGMGDDGADAMVKMREKGAYTLAQDESTSVVFGMPKEAFIRGGAAKLLPLEEIPNAILAYLQESY